MHFTCLTRSFTNARERMGNFTPLGLGKLNSMGSWCKKLSNNMGGWCRRKLNSMGGWVKKRCCLPPPGVLFWNSP